jgi:hypothetical protein
MHHIISDSPQDQRTMLTPDALIVLNWCVPQLNFREALA